MKTSNIFQNIPKDLSSEVFEDIISAKDIRIERIISMGQSSPAEGWYDQEESEWVILLEGAATLEFETHQVHLQKGDYIHIPAHTKHKVLWTTPKQKTIWLAIFYNFL